MRQLYRLTLLTAALTASASAVDPGMLQMADPEINLLIGVRMGELASSPLMLKVFDEGKKNGPGFGELIDQMGPNPFESIDEILIMGRIEAGEQPDAGQDALILARGRFPGSTLQDALCSKGCKPSSEGGVALQLLEHDGKPAAFAKLSDSYAVLGAEEKVRALIERRAAGGSPQFATRAQEWAKGLAAHHIWVAAQGPFEAPKGDGAPPFAEEMLSGLEGVGLGLTINDELLVSLDLRSKTEEDSKRLYTTLQGLLAMASASQASQEGGGASPADLLRQIQMSQGARRITATLRAPTAEIQKTLVARMGVEPEEGEGESETQAAAPREGAGKIRIYGLEAEPVEVDAGQP
jgi:hypothetical protein